MTAKELMNPRFEVIADYPNSPFENKDILMQFLFQTSTTGMYIYVTNMNSPLQGASINAVFVESMPHLFRKLNWWEKRKIEDMPKRLICKAIKDDTEIILIQEWDMQLLLGWVNKEERKCAGLRSFNPEYGYFPVD